MNKTFAIRSVVIVVYLLSSRIAAAQTARSMPRTSVLGKHAGFYEFIRAACRHQ